MAKHSAPKDTRIYAIGDVHGRLDRLQELLRAIKADLRSGRPARTVVVFLGDYIDRGPDSRAVVDTVMDPGIDGAEVVTLMGNHEQMMLDVLEGRMSASTWLTNGAGPTLESYGIGRAETARVGSVAESLRRHVPARHLGFLRRLDLYHREGDYLFVHAGLRPGVAISDQSEMDMLWIRGPFLFDETPLGPLVVHGHTVCDEPEIRPHRLGIDTGAGVGGALSCAVLEGTSVRFLATEADA